MKIFQSSSPSCSSSSSEEKAGSRTKTRTTTRKNHFARLAGFFTILLAAIGAMAQTTNALSGLEIRGRQLARQILEQRPAENFTNTGVLQIRDADGKRSEIPVRCEVVVTATNWSSLYEATLSNGWFEGLEVIHTPGSPNLYNYDRGHYRDSMHLIVSPQTVSSGLGSSAGSDSIIRNSPLLEVPFAGSDFWICDLGLEFFRWPGQIILRGETMRGLFCKVLESTNPNPPTNGYSRVVTWIDNESLGIVQAKAYDAKGNLLKDFYPNDFKKVDGQWQVGSMDIYNVQTRSRTTLKFDLKAK